MCEKFDTSISLKLCFWHAIDYVLGTARIGSRRGDPKTSESNFIHHEFLQFGKQHSRYKAILPSTLLSQECCKVYFICFTVAISQWDLTTWLPVCTGIAPLASLAGSAQWAQLAQLFVSREIAIALFNCWLAPILLIFPSPTPDPQAPLNFTNVSPTVDLCRFETVAMFSVFKKDRMRSVSLLKTSTQQMHGWKRRLAV